jgi:copper chaperone CopZ
MHCLNCDRLLTDYEATRKHAITFKFLDLCKVCFDEVKTIIPTIDNRSLMTEQDLDVDDEDDNLDTRVSLEDNDALYSYHDTVKYSSDDYDV